MKRYLNLIQAIDVLACLLFGGAFFLYSNYLENINPSQPVFEGGYVHKIKGISKIFFLNDSEYAVHSALGALFAFSMIVLAIFIFSALIKKN